MKKYLILIAAVAVIAGCSKHEVVDTPGLEGVTTKTYTDTIDLMAGKHHHAGTVIFLDPQAQWNSPGSVLEVTITLNQGWSMSELHFYAGPEIDLATGKSVMPVNKPGNPKIGNFPHIEENLNITGTYTFDFQLGDEDPGNFAIAFHAVVDKPDGGEETAWAQGDIKFRDKGWATYISNFYATSNYVPNDLYAIQRTTNGDFSLVLIDINTGTEEIIYSENITGSNGPINGAGYDPGTHTVFFTMGDALYANDLNNDDPTYMITNLNASDIGGTTFYGDNYYYYSNTLHQIGEVAMSYNNSQSIWEPDGENIVSPPMDESNFTVTDITSYNNTIYLIGPNSDDPASTVALLDYDITSSTFSEQLLPVIGMSSQVDSPPTIAATDNPIFDPNANPGTPEASPFLLISKNINADGEEELVGIDSVDGTLDDIPGEGDDPEGPPVILGK